MLSLAQKPQCKLQKYSSFLFTDSEFSLNCVAAFSSIKLVCRVQLATVHHVTAAF